jgi:hypothetical protein
MFGKRVVAVLVASVLISGLTSTSAFAQATGSISGRVTDVTGAVLPGVEVKLTRTDTGAVRDTVTNETGAYAFPSLNPGPFRLEIFLWVFARSCNPALFCRSAATS